MKETAKKTSLKGDGDASRAFFRDSRDLFNSVSDGVVVYEAVDSGNTFIIRDINKAAEQIEKVKRSEVIGRNVSEAFPGIERMGILSVFRRVWNTGKSEKYPAIIYEDKRISGWRENNVFKLTSGEVVATYRDLTAEKKAEDALRSSEKQYKDVFESMTDIVFWVDNKLRLKMLNNAGKNLLKGLGMSSDVIGKTLFEALPLLSRTIKKEYEELIITGKIFSGEVKYYFGKEVIIAQTKRIPIIEDGKVVGVIGIISDITKMKKNERALKESIDRFNFIASLAGEMIWESDMKGLITYISPAAEKILGYEVSELVGKKRYIELIDPEIREKVEGLIKQCYAKRSDFHRLIVIANKKDGEKITLELSGTPILEEEGGAIGYVGIATDITDRQAYEENLRKFKLAVENVSDHIIITDGNGVILYANNAASVITGFPIKEMIGAKPSLWGKQMPPEFYKDMWHRIKDLKENFVGEITNKKKNGEIYVAEVNISPIIDALGEVRFFVGIERDITKAKEIDRAKTEFVSIVSHQLRTPLSIISWYTEMLLGNDKGELTEGQKDYITEIHHSNHRMIDLVNALLSASRIDMGALVVSPEPVNFSDIAEVVLSEISPHIEDKKMTVTKDYDSVPTISADPSLVRVIFQNLISNAVKYTPAKGKISIKMELNDGEVIISVADNGYGIPKREQENIFSKLFRADNAREIDPDGTGLGLYIVKAIVESSGGRVWFKSDEGKGSTFYVSLPVTGMKSKK